MVGVRTGISEVLVPLDLPLGSNGDIGLERHSQLHQVDGGWCSASGQGPSGRSLGREQEIGALHRAGTAVRTASSTCRGWRCVEECPSPH